MKKIIYYYGYCLFLIYYGFYSSTALADDQTIGETADDFVSGPLMGLQYLASKICYIIGILLLIIAYQKFRMHRRNSQETPISYVITYFLMGALIILLPLTYYLVKMMPST